MQRFFLFVTAYPRAVLSIVGVLALGLGLAVFGLKTESSPDAFIPANHPALILKQQVQEDFGLREPIAVCVTRDAPEGIFVPRTLRLIRDMTRAIQELPEIDAGDVLSLSTAWGVYFEDGEPGFDRLMKEPPERNEEIAALRADVLGYELYTGTIVAQDGRAACILVRPEDSKTDDHTYHALQQLLAGFPLQDERLHIAGEAAVRARMGVAVSNDGFRMNFVCPVVMALLIVLAYRTWRGTILPLCVVGGAAVSALGVMSLAGVPVYIITNGIFVIIMALGVADSLHLVGQYYEEQLDARGRNRREIVVDSCMALWFPLLVTSLTDVAGFFALYLVGIMPPIRYFGLFTCAGILGALVCSFTVIPAALMLLPLQRDKVFTSRAGDAGSSSTAGGDGEQILPGVGGAMGRLGELALRRRWLFLAAGALSVAVAAVGASKLTVNDARILAFQDDHPLVLATRTINKRFDGTSHLNIVLSAPKQGGLLEPQVLQEIEALEAYTETLPFVGGTHSPAGWIKRAHQKMHDEDPAYYAIPSDVDETRFYLDVLSADSSPLAQLLGEVIDDTYTRANLIVRMRSSQYIHERQVVESLQRHLAETFADGSLDAMLAGRVNLDYHWLKVVRSSHINSVFFSSLCAFLLTALMFRSLVAGLLCTLTVGLAVLVNYAVMGFFDIPLGVGTSMFASISIGAGVNAPIHILDRLRVSLRSGSPDTAAIFRRSLAFTGRALFYTALVVAIGFLLLVVSEFRTLVRFGLLVAIGMTISFIASVTLLPAAVAVLRPRFLFADHSRISFTSPRAAAE